MKTISDMEDASALASPLVKIKLGIGNPRIGDRSRSESVATTTITTTTTRFCQFSM